jgi:hypothetical protein
MSEQPYDFGFIGLANELTLILGTFLFLCPWIFGFSLSDTFTKFTLGDYNAWACGCLVLGGISIGQFCEWRAWFNFLIGLWVTIAPWVLGFSSDATVRSSHVIVGVAVTGLAACAIYAADHRSQTSDEAGEHGGQGDDLQSNVVPLARHRQRIARYPTGPHALLRIQDGTVYAAEPEEHWRDGLPR